MKRAQKYAQNPVSPPWHSRNSSYENVKEEKRDIGHYFVLFSYNRSKNRLYEKSPKNVQNPVSPP
jgi:hypothetical protein